MLDRYLVKRARRFRRCAYATTPTDFEQVALAARSGHTALENDAASPLFIPIYWPRFARACLSRVDMTKARKCYFTAAQHYLEIT